MNRWIVALLSLTLAPAALRAAENSKQVMRDFSAAVDEYVERKSAESDDGRFRVKDEALGKTWKLKLKRVHKDNIARLGQDSFFACADFEGSAGRGGKQLVDLDFYVRRRAGEWEVQKVLVHKVEGQPRYTYNGKNERIPAAGAGPAKPAREKPKLQPVRLPGSPDGEGKGAQTPAMPSGQEHPAGYEHPR